MTDTLGQSLEPVTAFAEIARELTESLELPEVLRRIAARMLALTGAQGVSVIVPHAEMAEFIVHESPPPHSLIPVGFRFRPRSELVEALTERRDPLVLRNLHASPLVPTEIKARIDAQDLVIVPLRVGEELLGALIIAFTELPDESAGKLELLRAVGDQAAVAMRNAQLYEAARESSEQLVQAEKLSAVGQLVARVAHEINNPLATARLLVESLEAESLEAGTVEQLRSLGSELDRAAAVVRDVLLFVHKRRAETSSIALGPFVAGLIREMRIQLEAADVEIRLEIPDDLPPIAADRNGLRQVLVNLFDNALGALAGREAERRIVVRAARGPGSTVDLEVEDNGPGLPAELGARLFEPFVTTRPIGEGTGLGLAIAREIVEAHGGDLRATNVLEGGARFRVRLPLAGPVAAPTPGAQPAEAPQGLRVLVIDDEPALQRALRRVLHLLGCEVTSALTGHEGFELARKGPFDLILCDIRIPGMDGYELHERLRAEAPHVLDSIAYMSGDTMTREVRAFIESTGSPMLAKPFGRAQLEGVLRDIGTQRAV